MAMNSFLDNESYDVDKLTHDIFALLENKFLFGSSIDDSKHFVDLKDETIMNSLSKNDVGKVRILSIDGGGSTDGVLAAKSLVFLETSLCQKYGNPNARIADFFDVAAGSGVGGILAAVLFTRGKDGRPMFTANEALQFLVNNGGKLVSSKKKNGVFRGMFRSASKAERLFRQMFGESTMKDTVKPVLIPCYDLSTRAPFLFSRTDALENDSFDFKISDVCSATTADPTGAGEGAGAFQLSSIDNKTKIVAVDGGLTMNNPTAAAITHVLNNKHEFPFCDSVQDLLVVSLGNGLSDSGCLGQNLSRVNVIRIGSEGASDMVDEAVSMAFGGSVTSNYVRIQANGVPKKNRKELVEIAEKMLTQKNVESVLFRGKKVAEKTNLDKLNWFADELIKEHERRKLSIIPTVMFKQSSPRTSSATVSTISSY